MPLLSTIGAASAKGLGFSSQQVAARLVNYLVIAGGGSGGARIGGGGGAGGLRSTVTATGGGGSLETPLAFNLSTSSFFNSWLNFANKE
jgi:hypothetical protein